MSTRQGDNMLHLPRNCFCFLYSLSIHIVSPHLKLRVCCTAEFDGSTVSAETCHSFASSKRERNLQSWLICILLGAGSCVRCMRSTPQTSAWRCKATGCVPALHCMPHQALLCSSPFVGCHDAQEQALSLSSHYQVLALNRH